MNCTPKVRLLEVQFFHEQILRRIQNQSSTNGFSYNHGGIHQLLHKNRSYSPDFKQKVLEHRWQHGLSLKETAALFSIPNSSTIYQWEKQYLAYGKSGLLPKKKGRPSMKYKPKKRKQKPEPTYLEQLEAENAFLKMENAFLKKYNALIQQEEEEERRKRQR